MKKINVVAAVIRNTENHILATQRGYGEWKGWWEFPGEKWRQMRHQKML